MAEARRRLPREMPRLNFRRLISEFRQVEREIRKSRAPGLLRCEPVQNNLLEWEVDLTFPADSPLQHDLEQLAESLLDSSRNRTTLRVRFPPEYPASPPEVWIQWPRLRYASAPVSFGGRICNELLTHSGWTPGSFMLTVFAQLRGALVQAGARVDMALSVKRGYPSAPLQLHRLSTMHYPRANDFVKHSMTALSTTEAEPFLGDLSRLEMTDKIALPFEFTEELYGRASSGEHLDLPLMFEVKTQFGRKRHCAIFDFIQGIPPTCLIVPKWVMDDLFLDERECISIRGVKLNLITYVKVQPHTVDFYQAVQASGMDVNELLTESLSRFSALTEDTSVPIEIVGARHWVQIVELRPQGAVRIIDTDVQHHFEFQVDFDPAPDLEDEAALKARQDQLVARYRERREKQEAQRKTAEAKRAKIRQQRFEHLRDEAQAAAGKDDGMEGDVEIRLRLPCGTQLKARFRDGAQAVALVAFALRSDWAKDRQPWCVRLINAFPRGAVQDSDQITKSMHRSMMSVVEDPEPDPELDPEPQHVEDTASCGIVGQLPSAGSAAPGSPSAKPARVESTAAEEVPSMKDMVTSRFRCLDRSGKGAVRRDQVQRVLRILDSSFWTEQCLDMLLAASGMAHRDQIYYEGFFEWVFADNCRNISDLDEQALRRRTEKAFQVQCFIQAGVELTEAVRRVEAGEILPPSLHQVSSDTFFTPTVSPAAVTAAPPTVDFDDQLSGRMPHGSAGDRREVTDSAAEVKTKQIHDVMDLSGASQDAAVEALEITSWDTEAALNVVLDRILGQEEDA